MTVTVTKLKTVTLITGNDAINTAIENIKASGKKLDALIHQVAVSCINHVELHGDIRVCNRLIDSMPKSSRRLALIKWFEDYGKLSYTTETKNFAYDNNKETDLTTAQAVPFWEHTKEQNPMIFDLDKAINNLIKRAESAMNKEQEVDKAKYEALLKLAPKNDTEVAA